jgi:hypothetical protein
MNDATGPLTVALRCCALRFLATEGQNDQRLNRHAGEERGEGVAAHATRTAPQAARWASVN